MTSHVISLGLSFCLWTRTDYTPWSQRPCPALVFCSWKVPPQNPSLALKVAHWKQDPQVRSLAPTVITWRKSQQARLDCAHPTPHNIWGSFFRTLIRDSICIINIFRLNCKWHICSPSPPPWQTMCYKHSFFSSVNTWCLSFACCFSHFPPWGCNNPVWPVPVWSHPFCLQCSNQMRTCLRQLPILTGHSAWVLNLGFLKMLPKGFKRCTKFFEVLGEYTCVCMFWAEGSLLPFEFRWVFTIQKTVKNHMLHDFTHTEVQNR